MEYDNDKLRKRTPKLEILYWIVLALVQPVTTIIIVFPSRPLIWFFPLLINLLVFPAYILYARIAGPTVSGEKQKKAWLNKRWFTIAMTIVSFLVILAFLQAVYALLLQFNLPPALKAYLTPNATNLAREVWWTAVN